MRDLLTYIGIALIVVLTAAFAAPYLLDFDAFRPRIAEQLSLASGAQVRLNGPVVLRFLPTPRFHAQNLDLSGDLGHLHVDKAQFALSLPGLLQGGLQFSQAELDGADIAIDADQARRLKMAAALQFDNLTVRRAHVTVARNGKTALDIAGLDVSAQIPSLAGPIIARGAFRALGREIAFSLATDIVKNDVLPIKAKLTLPDAEAKLDLDGRMALAETPAFEAAAKAEGRCAAGPWTAEGALVLGLGDYRLKEFAARLGDGPLADKMSGDVRLEGGRLAVAAEATTLSAPWADFLASPLFAKAADAPPLDLRVNVKELNWRGNWTDAQLIWRAGAPVQVMASGPGAARVDISASPDAQGWRGKAHLNAEDFTAFAGALREEAPTLAGALAGANIRALDMSGDFSAAPEQWSLSHAALAFDGGRLSGDISYRAETADGRPVLVARLSAPALDLAAAPDFAGVPLEGLDLDLALEAQSVKSSRGRTFPGEGGRIKAHLRRTGQATWLDRLDMHNFNGADLTAYAAWGRDIASLQGEARLKAADLAPLAQALARLWPGPATKALAARAKSLSPADVAGKAEDGAFTLNGSLGATKLAASVIPAKGGGQAVALDLTAPEAGPLLNQLGAQVVWTQRLGPARFSARAQPGPLRNSGPIVTASAELAGLHADLRGAMTDPDKDPTVAGVLTIAGDAGKVLGFTSGAPSPSSPVRLAAHASWRDDALSLQQMEGEWAGARFSGELAFGADGVKGALRSARLSAPGLAALALGPPAPVKTGALWPSLSFAPVVFDPPTARLAVETDDLQPLGARARFDLMLGAGVLSVANVHVEAFGGVARGGLDLRREGGQATLSGELKVADVALNDPAFSARLDGKLKFAGSGGNAAALVGSLAGEGATGLSDLTIEGAAPEAPDAALAESETDDAPFDARAVAKSLDSAFARGALRRTDANFALRLAGGQLSLTPANDSAKGLQANFDLRDAALSLTFSAQAQKLPPGWDGPPFEGAVAWSGPWRAPSRRVDATGFVSAVAARALEREQARIEKMKREDEEWRRAQSPPPAASQVQPAPEP
jgi:hypothetical protein